MYSNSLRHQFNNIDHYNSKMELSWVWMIVATFLACYIFVKKIVRKSNEWYYDMKLGNKHGLLPPGDMGWPLIGNIIPFIKDFNSGHPDSFINNLHSKFKSFLLSSILFLFHIISMYTYAHYIIKSYSSSMSYFIFFCFNNLVGSFEERGRIQEN